MANELTLALLRAALLTSPAIVLLLLIRKPLRRWLGAATAYQAWLIVPCASLAAILPNRSATLIQAAPALRSARTLAARTVPHVAAQVDLLLLLWACGAVACIAWTVMAHRAFLRRAGRLRRVGEVYVSAADLGPASVGLLRPKIVVPHDFRRRYSMIEQNLIIAHEQTHIARHDAVANLFAAVFLCVFWFNPLCHLGLRYFRQDQELACDALVMQQYPRQRRAYAQALLKSHAGIVVQAGIHCHWQTQHPTKERLMSLQLSPSGTVRRLAGRCIVGLLAAAAVAGTLSARAEQAASKPAYNIAMALDAGGDHSTPRVLTREGEQFAVASGEWRIEMTVRAGTGPENVWLMGKILKGGEVLGTPTLLTRLDEKATIKVGASNDPFALTMTVSPQP
jgi:bla regulator protein blaR1